MMGWRYQPVYGLGTAVPGYTWFPWSGHRARLYPSTWAMTFQAPTMYRARNPYHAVAVGAAEGPPGAMALAGVRSIEQYAGALIPYAGQLPAWGVFKVTRARQRLSDAAFYVMHGQVRREVNGGPKGYMAAQELAQLVDDAHWLAGQITPDTRLPEWVESYITQAQVDVHDAYAAVVRGPTTRQPNPRGRQPGRPGTRLGDCPEGQTGSHVIENGEIWRECGCPGPDCTQTLVACKRGEVDLGGYCGKPTVVVPQRARLRNPDVRAIGLASLLAHLRALYQLHQNAHWQTQGAPFYADHLMFQRLYEETQGLADGMAERLLGLEGATALDGTAQAATQHRLLTTWQGAAPGLRLPERNLAAVQQTIEAYENVSRRLQAAGEQTLGLEDLLPAQASALETHAYLLRQRVAGTQSPGGRNGLGQQRAIMDPVAEVALEALSVA